MNRKTVAAPGFVVVSKDNAPPILGREAGRVKALTTSADASASEREKSVSRVCTAPRPEKQDPDISASPADGDAARAIARAAYAHAAEAFRLMPCEEMRRARLRALNAMIDAKVRR